MRMGFIGSPWSRLQSQSESQKGFPHFSRTQSLGAPPIPLCRHNARMVGARAGSAAAVVELSVGRCARCVPLKARVVPAVRSLLDALSEGFAANPWFVGDGSSDRAWIGVVYHLLLTHGLDRAGAHRVP